MTASIHHTDAHSHCQPRRPSFLAGLGQVIAVAHQRRRLLALDDHLLNDIGVTRAQAHEESRQSAWNAPGYWRK
ncbi:DUF1127 domain-containing protein [Yoonia sp.]|uniref:DUF1127 domain-containing protein n=1 Tax=Yoonia sp. TaxID=2212373 RepID=UPI0039749B3B